MRKTAFKKWLPILFLGICLILTAFAGAALLFRGAQPLSASAASEFWGIPNYCPECGAVNSSSNFTQTEFKQEYMDTYTYTHYVRSGTYCTGTVTIHTPTTVPEVKATCTTSGHSSYVMCAYCHKLNSSNVTYPALGHNYGEYETVKEPTCTTAGEESSKCTRCSARQSKEIPALGHDWNDWETTVPATCTSSGSREHSCALCGETESEVIPMTGHDWSDWTTTRAASCRQTGLKERTCSLCGERETETLPMLDHTFGSTPVRATCTKGGYTYYWCQVCGYSYTTPNGGALGHQWSAYSETTSPTCTTSGVETSYCQRPGCGEVKTQSVPALGHDFGEYITSKAATCTQEGMEMAACSRCSETTTRSIAALGHDLTEHAGKPATCTETGWAAYETCSRCTYTTFSETAALGHDFGSYTTTKAATCTEDGLKVSTCSRCSETVSETIPALGHTVGTEATCTEAQVCKTCGEVLSAATGHTPGEAATCTTAQLCSVCGIELAPALRHDIQTHEAKSATCTETGWSSYETCSRCDYTTYAETPALGHLVGDAPTCLTPQLCTRCGTELAPALGHTAGKEATCTEAQVCTVCGAELAPALGHDISVMEAVSPTCLEDGLSEGARCLGCGEVLLEQSVVPALGHLLLAAEDSRESCTDEGTLTRRCARCDYSETESVSGGTHSWRPGEVLSEPTCSETGIRELVCAFCEATELEEIAKTSHKLSEVESVAPTCTTPGMSSGIMCLKCGEVLLMREELPPTGHLLAFREEVSPTDTAEGMRAHYVCTVCGALFLDEKGTEVSEAELTLPALTPSEDPEEVPDETEDIEEEGGLTWWQTTLAVLAAVLLVVCVAGLFAYLVRREKEPNG